MTALCLSALAAPAVPVQDEPLWKAAQNGHAARLTELLGRGEAIDAQDPRFQATALMYAAGAGRLEALKVLLQYGAKVNLQDAGGETALYMAAQKDFPDCVTALLDAGADPNLAKADGNTPLIRLSYRRDTAVLKRLLAAKPNLNALNNDGESALMLAAWEGRPASIELILKAGADVNLENANGETALIKAGQRGRVDLVTALASAGAKKTQIFLNKHPERDETLTPAQRWALATSAMMMQYNAESHEILGFGPPSRKRYNIEQLKSGWKIENREDLLSTLSRSRTTGMRKELQKKMPALAATPKKLSDFDALFHPPKQASTPSTLEHERFLAWDLCRYVSLVRSGVTSEYLTPEEAWQMIMPVAKRIQANYRSWEEMGEDYLAGRDLWNEQPDMRYRAVYKLLINKNDPNSPWNKCPWETPLE